MSCGIIHVDNRIVLILLIINSVLTNSQITESVQTCFGSYNGLYTGRARVWASYDGQPINGRPIDWICSDQTIEKWSDDDSGVCSGADDYNQELSFWFLRYGTDNEPIYYGKACKCCLAPPGHYVENAHDTSSIQKIVKCPEGQYQNARGASTCM